MQIGRTIPTFYEYILRGVLNKMKLNIGSNKKLSLIRAQQGNKLAIKCTLSVYYANSTCLPLILKYGENNLILKPILNSISKYKSKPKILFIMLNLCNGGKHE